MIAVRVIYSNLPIKNLIYRNLGTCAKVLLLPHNVQTGKKKWKEKLQMLTSSECLTSVENTVELCGAGFKTITWLSIQTKLPEHLKITLD